MYIQKFYPEHCIILRNILLQCIGLFFSLFLTGGAWALSTDKDQPIEIEADTADLDDEKGISIYRGNVVTTQGSVRMTGDIMTVYFTNDELDTLIMEGNPATYRQLPDDSEVYDEAEALRMEYYELKSLVILINKASFKQEGLSFSGNRIEYDTENSKVKAKSSVKQQNGSRERVKIIIKPKKKKE